MQRSIDSSDISIHAPCTGSDQKSCTTTPNLSLFQSTLPARGATFLPFSVLVPRRISIHAPCTGSDDDASPVGLRDGDFNPRSLHGERPYSVPQRPPQPRFQSTLPARGATFASRRFAGGIRHFNPRSLHGERPAHHAAPCLLPLFQSTLPARGATVIWEMAQFYDEISIHAPCTGSDLKMDERLTQAAVFQSTLPARGATPSGLKIAQTALFQSTLPARGATDRC